MTLRKILLGLLVIAAAPIAPVRAESIRVAAASNVGPAIQELAARFEQSSAHEVRISRGSTGKLYAQIRNGAPFDLFFAADSERPRRLEEEGLAVAGSRCTYALGRLVLWSAHEGRVDPVGQCLERDDFRHLAIANPRLAPYGQAAVDVLTARGLWSFHEGRIIRGENIAQTYHFVKSGNAELGFVALSQLRAPGREDEGSQWEVPQELYEPIVQQAVLLTDRRGPREFLAFVVGDEGRRVLESYGYGEP